MTTTPDDITRLATAPRPRNRQRQRLIDACISALHIHGPSRTTVEKVVSIANLSPGIVRFYFKSKAAMLVASLQYLASEFDEKVLEPVSAIRDTPVEAMRLLVDLYLDPELASPRKISVWYAFWGEASSRQEYYEICGHKDDSFVALVRDLIRRLVTESGEAHLDVEALSLGFIGLLEVLWQGFAYQFEADIDRQAARERCYAYLRSLFPRQFGQGEARSATAWPVPAPRDVTRRDSERFGRIAQPVGHVADIPLPGDAKALDVGDLPVVLIRDDAGAVRGYVNRCSVSPHELVPAGASRPGERICCRVHGLTWNLNGRPCDADGGSLIEVALETAGGLIFLRAERPEAGLQSTLLGLVGIDPAWRPLADEQRLSLNAEWSVVAEHWLDAWFGRVAARRLGITTPAPAMGSQQPGAGDEWSVDAGQLGGSFTASRYAKLVLNLAERRWRRAYIGPNLLVDRYAGGMTLQWVRPRIGGGSELVVRAYVTPGADRRERALGWLGARVVRHLVADDLAVIASLQRARSAAAR